MVAKDNQISEMWMADSSPEKAGVGGSIPSLATMESTTYRCQNSEFGPNWSQNL
jgi:hypothetical protein